LRPLKILVLEILLIEASYDFAQICKVGVQLRATFHDVVRKYIFLSIHPEVVKALLSTV